MNPENRNLILAITLSMAVLFGWQVFFVGPELEREAARQQVIAEQIAAADAESRSTLADSAGGTAAMPAAGGDDATTAVAAPRITIDAPQIAGSISLAGLRIDDVVLRDYQETQAEDSPNIQLLQRTDAKLPFFAEFRWTLNGTGVALPDASTVWTADRDVLSPGAPVTFTWDNGQGLLFSRQMAIDENYLFTIIDAVRNDTGATLAFNHYGRVRRHGTPTTSGIWILHEGPIGVFDEIVSYQNYDDLADTRTDKRKAEDLTFDGSQGGWIGFSDKYWLTALIPDQQSPLNFKFSEFGAQDALYQAGYINAQAQSIASGGTLEFTTRLFAGAKKVTLLDSYGETYGLAKFDRAIDFGWFYFLTKPFFYAINWLNGVLGNFGLAVMAFNHYGRVRRHGTPTTSGIWILHEGPIGVFDEIVSYQNYDDLADTRTDKRKAEDLTFDGSQGGWIGFSDKYWLTALIPDQQSPLNFKFSEFGAQDALYQAGYINAQAQSIASGGTLEFTTRLFAGAKKVTLLDSYGETYGLAKFDRAIDFGWFYFLTKPFFYAINWLNGVLGNFGLAVIAFTVVVKLVFFPLANKSYRSMGKMRLLSPKIQQIRERHADDRMAMNKEMMELYKKEQINPAAGCLPVLLQIPVFFALYKVLFVTIEMRHAPFFGWITDLSAPDPTSVFNVFGLLPFGVDFLPPFMQLGAWPIMMGLSMFFQMRLNPAPPDPVQARIFQFMPLIFTFLLATFPAGLVIYWTWNNLLSMAQQWYIIRSIAKEA